MVTGGGSRRRDEEGARAGTRRGPGKACDWLTPRDLTCDVYSDLTCVWS